MKKQIIERCMKIKVIVKVEVESRYEKTNK